MSPARILITEDSLGIARALARALTLGHDGTNYDVKTCESGEKAQELLSADHYDLLISDLRLPGMDGLNLLEWTRQQFPEMRSVLITAYGSPQVEDRARCVANAYLPKPFRLNDLLQLVQHVLEEAPQPESALDQASGPPSYPVVVKTGSMHLMILASDLDGTLAENGVVAAETWDMLRKARSAGLTIILVTGRALETFITDGPFNELCEAIVAENGAIVYFPRRDTISFPFGRLTPAVLQRLDSLDIPLERGMAIVATVVPHDAAILEILRTVGGGATVEYNRGSVMVLPLGATKGTGLQYALREMGYSPHNVVACGDAENDRSLFEVAEFAAAVASAPPGIKALADMILPYPNGAGVRSLLEDLIANNVPAYRSRPYRNLSLGRLMNGGNVHIDPFNLLNKNLGIFGASSSGKSWLAGLLTEELLKQGYQVCVIDPEGDYRSLGAGPHTMTLGGSSAPLPSVTDVVNFLENGALSLILDLSMAPAAENASYILELLRALQSLRVRRGRPHWFLLDEAQNYINSGDGELIALLLEISRRGGLGIVSYRPSQIEKIFLERISQWLLTRLNLPEDIEAIKPHISSLPGSEELLLQLPDLPVGQAYICMQDTEQWLPPPEGVVRFQVGPRSVPHIRHLHKYLRAPLPAPKRFYFHDGPNRYLGRSAANLWEFNEALREISIESIQYHLPRGDFERWVQDVLRDAELARRLHKVVSRNLSNQELRQALAEAVHNRYEELESLA